jgi:hypothetical protein
MRDLTIVDTHTYYVVAGTTAVLVHNNNGDVCDVFRFGDRDNPNELLPDLLTAPQNVINTVNMLMKNPRFRADKAMLHADGITERSPFISVVRDVFRAAETTDTRLQLIVRGAPDIAHLKVPSGRLYTPDSQLSGMETELLFDGVDLADYLVGWTPNPFRLS